MKSKIEVEEKIKELIHWNEKYSDSIKKNIPNHMNAVNSALDKINNNNCTLDTLNWILNDE
jgi:hypothetical protein